MRILLTGAKGQLGQCFRDRMPENWELIATDSASLDISDSEAVRNMIRNFQPDAIVNAAAYTSVDDAETDIQNAFRINSQAVHNLAAAAYAAHVRFIHISTDYVFDGNTKKPYSECDYPYPTSVYGQSKLAGELQALAANPDALVVRTAWLFSEYGSNFVKKIIAQAKEQDVLKVVASQTGSPTYAGDLANVLLTLLESPATIRGIYHYGGNKAVSWYEFAQAIFQTASLHGLPTPQLEAIDETQSPLPAKRPAYSVLDSRKIEQECAVKASDWQKALNDIIALCL